MRIILSFLAIAVFASALPAQAPKPVVVQAANSLATSAQTPAAPDNSSGSIQGALKMLQEMKAANEETLRKQAATLEQLDELEKAADQLRVFSKRN
jgi:hypothetical protein